MSGSVGIPGIVVPRAAIIAKKAIGLLMSKGRGPGGGGGKFAILSMLGIDVKLGKLL
jgi:hypothetical protein